MLADAPAATFFTLASPSLVIVDAAVLTMLSLLLAQMPPPPHSYRCSTPDGAADAAAATVPAPAPLYSAQSGVLVNTGTGPSAFLAAA